MRDLAFSYQVGQLYSIEWQVNIDTDQFGLTIDGTQVASAVSLGTDAVSFRQLIFANNFNTSGSSLIDNVVIATVPEPSAWILLLSGIIPAAAGRRYRRIHLGQVRGTHDHF